MRTATAARTARSTGTTTGRTTGPTSPRAGALAARWAATATTTRQAPGSDAPGHDAEAHAEQTGGAKRENWDMILTALPPDNADRRGRAEGGWIVLSFFEEQSSRTSPARLVLSSSLPILPRVANAARRTETGWPALARSKRRERFPIKKFIQRNGRDGCGPSCFGVTPPRGEDACDRKPQVSLAAKWQGASAGGRGGA